MSLHMNLSLTLFIACARSGWRFGAVYGKLGVFPSEYVHPVAAPDFLVLPPDRVEPRDRQGRVAASAAVAVAMGSAVAAHELDLSTEVQTRKLLYMLQTTSLHLTSAFTVKISVTEGLSDYSILLYYGIRTCLYSIN